MKIEAVVFDLDGTLLDTLEDLRDSVNFALAENDLPVRSTEEIRSFVGNGIRLLIERAVPANTQISLTDKCFEDFKAHYKNNSANKTKPYEGILELLELLKTNNVKLAMVSNKADFAVKALAEEYFKGFFDCAYGERNGVPRKPAPDGVLDAVKELGCSTENSVYVGDSEVDVETAANAGLHCIAVTWGFRDKEVLKKLNPKYIVNKPKEISGIILKR